MALGFGRPARSGVVWRGLAVIALLLGLMIGLLAQASTASAAPPTPFLTFSMPGSAGPMDGRGDGNGTNQGAGYFNTNFTLNGGPLTITADGQIQTSPQNNPGGPDGNGVGNVCGSQYLPTYDCLAPNLPWFSLIARVGGGPWIFIGSGPKTITGTGLVELAYNDDRYDDNTGAFNVYFFGATKTVANATAAYGDTTATLTAKVTSGGGPVTSGKVKFTFQGNVIDTVDVNAQGVATVTAPLPPGTLPGTYPKQVLAEYLENVNFLGSQDLGPLVVSRKILYVKPIDLTVKLKQPNPTTCTLELANGSTFVTGDGWSAINVTNLRCTNTRNYPSSNASETVGKTYKISATAASSALYDLRYVQGTLTVVP